MIARGLSAAALESTTSLAIWRCRIRAVRATTFAKIGLELDFCAALDTIDAADFAGFELLDLVASKELLEFFPRARAVWPQSKPIAVRFDERSVDLARSFVEAGADLLHLAGGAAAASARLRLELGVATMIDDGVSSSDDANTHLAAGRADLSCDPIPEQPCLKPRVPFTSSTSSERSASAGWRGTRSASSALFTHGAFDTRSP